MSREWRQHGRGSAVADFRAQNLICRMRSREVVVVRRVTSSPHAFRLDFSLSLLRNFDIEDFFLVNAMMKLTSLIFLTFKRT